MLLDFCIRDVFTHTAVIRKEVVTKKSIRMNNIKMAFEEQFFKVTKEHELRVFSEKATFSFNIHLG